MAYADTGHVSGAQTDSLLRGGFRVFSKSSVLYAVNLTIALTACYSAGFYWGSHEPLPMAPQAVQEASSVGQPGQRAIPESGGAAIFAKLGAVLNFRDQTPSSEGFYEAAQDNWALLNAISSGRQWEGMGIIVPANFSPKHVGLGKQNPITTQIRRAVEVASAESKVKRSWIYAVGSSESNWKPDKAETSSATGVMQHLDQDWLNAMGKFGRDLGFGRIVDQMRFDGKNYHIDNPKTRQTVLDMRLNAEHSIRLGAALLADNIAMMEDHLGREITLTEAYITYFLGYGNAQMALDNLAQHPNRRVRDVPALIKSIGANSWMSDMTFAEFHDWADKKMSNRQIFYAFKEGLGGADVTEAIATSIRTGKLQDRVHVASFESPTSEAPTESIRPESRP
jgi:hypothetical protein